MIGFAKFIVSKLCRPASTPDPNRWSDHQLLDYCEGRYAEIDGLVSKTRSAGASLLVWQTAFLVGTLGVEAKTGLLGYEPFHPALHLLTAMSVVLLSAAVIVSARVAFWADITSIPVPPGTLLDHHEQDHIEGKEVCRSFVRVYRATKEHLAELQRLLRNSIVFTGVGLLFFTALFVLISLEHKALFERAFGLTRR
jgi:hypothetical protein